MADKPFIEINVSEWKKSPNIQTLTLEEKGAWVEILMLMHESEYPGVLMIRGEPMPFETLAGLLRIDNHKAENIVGKLIATGVAEYHTDTRTVYHDGMKRAEDIRRSRSKAGQAGGLAKAIAEKERREGKETDIK